MEKLKELFVRRLDCWNRPFCMAIFHRPYAGKAGEEDVERKASLGEDGTLQSKDSKI